MFGRIPVDVGVDDTTNDSTTAGSLQTAGVWVLGKSVYVGETISTDMDTKWVRQVTPALGQGSSSSGDYFTKWRIRW